METQEPAGQSVPEPEAIMMGRGVVFEWITSPILPPSDAISSPLFFSSLLSLRGNELSRKGWGKANTLEL